jgi:formylglycine-generating enzyme required for sulfatase activity
MALRWLLPVLLFSGFSVSAGGLEIKALDKEQGALVFKTADSGTVHHSYRIEASTSLVSAAWSVCSTAGGVGAAASVTSLVTADSPSMFYRVVATSNSAIFVDGEYMVVDLSGGAGAVTYAVEYYSGASAVPGGVTNDIYKTTKLLLRKIPKGSFTMGSPAGELGRDSNETQHQVTLTKDFYMGVFEVTQRQWELVMGDRPSYFNNAACYSTRPVESITYNMIRENTYDIDDPAVDWPNNSAVNAKSFMGKLRAKTGLSTFDLPTESQWEYACRVGTTTALNTGYNLTSAISDPRMYLAGRYWFNSGSGYYTQNGDTRVGTAKAGSYLPNAWGLYDMNGNVWECCLDWFGTYPGAVSDPPGVASGSSRVGRGGCWDGYAYYCRSAFRGDFSPNYRYSNFGFRAARTLP